MAKIAMGNHLSLMYDSKKELLKEIIPYIKESLENNKRCIYVVSDNTVEELKSAIFEFDRKLFESSIENNSFIIFTKDETYLINGEFDPDRLIRLIQKKITDALKSGFDGLFAVGEMSWFFDERPGSDRLIEYESKLNEFLGNNKFTSICAYNKKEFSAELQKSVLRTHYMIMENGTPNINPCCVVLNN